MIPYGDVHITIGLPSLAIYWFLGCYSLNYFLYKTNMHTKERDTFTEKLIWPLRIVYRRNLPLIKGLEESLARQGTSNAVGTALANRIGFVGFGIVLPIIYIAKLTQASTAPEVISLAIGLLTSSYLLYRAWFFGHKLKDIQAEAPDTEVAGE